MEAKTSLQWPLIEARIQLKIIMLTWKAFNNMALSYIKNMLKIKNVDQVYILIKELHLKYQLLN